MFWIATKMDFYRSSIQNEKKKWIEIEDIGKGK